MHLDVQNTIKQLRIDSVQTLSRCGSGLTLIWFFPVTCGHMLDRVHIRPGFLLLVLLLHLHRILDALDPRLPKIQLIKQNKLADTRLTG